MELFKFTRTSEPNWRFVFSHVPFQALSNLTLRTQTSLKHYTDVWITTWSHIWPWPLTPGTGVYILVELNFTTLTAVHFLLNLRDFHCLRQWTFLLLLHFFVVELRIALHNTYFVLYLVNIRSYKSLVHITKSRQVHSYN